MNIKARIGVLWQSIRPKGAKQIAVWLLAAMLLITPTISAHLYIYYVDHVQHSQSFSVTLYDEDGALIAQDSGIPNSAAETALFEQFYRLVTRLKSTGTSPGDPENDPYILAETSLNGVTTTYHCYFSLVETTDYCIDGNGQIYLIDRQDSETFLASSYAESFYAAATVPTLSTIDGEEILPTSVDWQYKTYANTFLTATSNQTATSQRSYTITGEVGLRFSGEPDHCTVRVYRDEQEIRSGGLNLLPSLIVAPNEQLRLHLRATWQKNDEQDFYGTLEYDFLVSVRNRSEFSLNKTTLSAGEVALLTCTNVSDLSRLRFSSEDTSIVPTFHRDGELVCGLIPFPDTYSDETFRFTFSNGASAQSFTIHVTPADEPNSVLPKDTSAAERYIATLSEFSTLQKQILPNEDTFRYFRGNFADPSAQGYSVGIAHGTPLKHDDGETSSLLTIGCELIAPTADDTAVATLHHGTVLAVGSCELLGNYVVVDHGLGLLTWYGQLSTVHVARGDVVARGDSLGQSGTLPLSDQNGFLLLATVYDTVIDPALLFGQSIEP